MSDKPDLAAIVAQIICDGLKVAAKDFHNRKVVFVDNEAEIVGAIRIALAAVARKADPLENVGFSCPTRQSVKDVVQKTLLERDDGH